MSKIATDIIGREIAVGDYIYSYSYLYKVLEVGHITVTAMIHPRSGSSKKKKLFGRECCLIPEQEMTMWILKNGKI